jgi:hypothetical protein
MNESILDNIQETINRQKCLLEEALRDNYDRKMKYRFDFMNKKIADQLSELKK